MVIYSFFAFSDSRILEIEPKIFALGGVVLMLVSETKIHRETIKNSLKPLSFIGLSSYSAYLLHQPIFAYYRQYLSINYPYFKRVELLIYEKILLIVITLLLSYIFYIFIEKKFLRDLTKNKQILLSIGFLFLLVFSYNTKTISDFKYSRNLEVTSFYIDFKTRLSSYTRDIEFYSATQNDKNCYDAPLDETCIFNPEEQKQIVLLGDSHSIELGKLLATKIKNYKITILTGNNCLYIFENNIKIIAKERKNNLIIIYQKFLTQYLFITEI